MKKLLPMLLLAAIVAGCDSHNLSEQDKNQPLYPTMWSPVGKKYFLDRSNDHPYGYEYCVEVIDFISVDSAAWYGTVNADFTPMDKHYNPAWWKMSYPNVTLYFPDSRSFRFIDTLTLYSESWNQTFTLVR